MAIYRVFPHCDMHLALDPPAASTIDYRVFEYHGPSGGPYNLQDVTAQCDAQMLAPHNDVGSRLEEFVTIDNVARTITADAVGTNLVILQGPDTYIVVRVQVHAELLGWWFGHETMTAPMDPVIAHSQPSIYALFSDDDTGTDRAGDITGHGFVTLASDDPAVFTVENTNNEGRILGLAEGSADLLGGPLLGINHSLPIEVVDYTSQRDILEPVRVGDLANAAERHNVLFLAEGFTSAAEDRAKFDQLVTQAAADLFTKPRHEPYGALSDSFNVFKAYTESNQRLVTCGWQVTDNEVDALGRGRPIPYDKAVTDDESMYEVGELVNRVGLPMRGEGRNLAQLTALWNSQGLDDFDDDKVNADVVEAWKNSHAVGFLEARDTFFGMILGTRYADKSSTREAGIPTPAADDDSAALKAFVKRCYEFYRPDGARRHIGMDPRRHAPEVFLDGNESRASAFMTFLSGLRMTAAPHEAIGTEWVPDGTFKRSRGLIAMIMNEHMHGGTNLNDSTVTANSIEKDRSLTANYVASPDPNIRILRREVPALEGNIGGTINTISHEFGHSFNLGDEYEEISGDRPNRSDDQDNIASYQTIAKDPTDLASREIDATKIKWAELPRIKASARLTEDSSGNLDVTIDPGQTGPWEQARVAGDEVRLRRVIIEPDGKQLPFSAAAADLLTGLTIDSVDQDSGEISLSGAAAPPVFPTGSSLFVPLKTESGTEIHVVEQKVRAHLNSEEKPLNRDPDVETINRDADYPVEIDDFKPPCQSARLVGVFEGAKKYTGLVYRPTGTCKMRSGSGEGEHGQFCHVCMWLITNRVDPGKHAEIDRRFYPVAKKNG